MARYYNRGWRRGFYRGRSYSSKQGSSTFTCRIPLEDVVQFTIPATVSAADPKQWSELICTCPYASFTGESDNANLAKLLTRGSLMDSYLYKTYTRIYDQVKINAVSVSIGLMEGVGIGGALSAVRLYTNWDRDLSFEEIHPGKLPSTAEELATGSESQSYLIVNNSRQTFKRYIYARDVQERTTFHDCSYHINQAETVPVAYIGDEQWAPLVVISPDIPATRRTGYGSSRQCGFVPSLMMSVWAPGTSEVARVVPVSLKVTYSVTFRMPKFGLSSGSVSRGVSSLRMDAVEDVKAEIEDEKKMEETPVLKKKKVVYEEEVLPDFEEEEDDEEESQAPLTQPFKSPMKKAGKKMS